MKLLHYYSCSTAQALRKKKKKKKRLSNLVALLKFSDLSMSWYVFHGWNVIKIGIRFDSSVVFLSVILLSVVF